MGYKIDQAEKRMSNVQAFLDFCTVVVVISIAWVRKWIKMIKGQAALTLF
jgi:hypothetical protein